VNEIMDGCYGTVVVAFERTYSELAVQRRGSDEEKVIEGLTLPTVWNQIEAAMAYTRGHPLLVIVEPSLEREGLLDQGYDWFVQEAKPGVESFGTPELLGRVKDWKRRVEAYQASGSHAAKPQSEGQGPSAPRPGDLTIGQLVGGLRPTELWAVLGAAAGALVAAFLLGVNLPQA
jgi:hypothetical protein